MPYATWMQRNAPTWLQDQYGQAWMAGIGASLDDYAQQYVAGTLASFPDYAPADALGVIGDELGLDQGPTETNASYAARLAAAWTYWKLAGTPVGILTAIYFAGFGGGVLVQQNGLAYELSAAPTPGADPTSLIVSVSCSPLIEPLTSNVTVGRSIPANDPWWTFDNNTDFCSRFALLYNSPSPSFYTTGRAIFSATNSATLTWSRPFGDTTYLTIPGKAVVTDGLPGVTVSLDGTSLTTTGATVNASDAFTGWVDVLAWQASATDPFVDIHAPDLARLQNVIRKWRPAKATCVGVYVAVQDIWWGPSRIVQGFGGYQMAAITWGDGTNWGPSTVVSIAGSF